MTGCTFCLIAARKRPAKILYEDEHCLAIQDLYPKAPVHVLVIPRKHISSLNENPESEEMLLGHLLAIAARMAKENSIETTGFRIVINTNADGGQTIFHLHLHVLGGRALKWPPG